MNTSLSDLQPTGLVYAFLAVVSWSICIFPFTIAARKLGSAPLNHFRLPLAVLLVGVLSVAINRQAFTGIFNKTYAEPWLWLGLSGFIGLAIGDHFAFTMYSILGARLGSVLTTLAPAATLLLGSLIAEEHISLIGISGILITIIGVNWVSLNKSEKASHTKYGNGTLAKGVLSGIIAAAGQGAGLVLAKKGLKAATDHHIDLLPVHATFMRMFSASILLWVGTLIRGRSMEVLRPVLSNREKGLSYAVAGTLFGPFIGVTLSIYSIVYIPASVAQTMFSLVPVFALFIAHYFSNERITWRSGAGIIISILGVIILIWREQLKELL